MFLKQEYKRGQLSTVIKYALYSSWTSRQLYSNRIRPDFYYISFECGGIKNHHQLLRNKKGMFVKNFNAGAPSAFGLLFLLSRLGDGGFCFRGGDVGGAGSPKRKGGKDYRMIIFGITNPLGILYTVYVCKLCAFSRVSGCVCTNHGGQ